MKQQNFKIIFLALVLSISFKGISQQVVKPSKAIDLALEHNYGIKMVNNSIAIAENNKSILNSGFLPTLTANAGATYNLDNTEAEFSDGRPSASINGAESSRYNASVNLGYTLFDGLGRRYNYKRLKEEHALSKLEARETIENVVIQLFTVYYALAKTSENKSLPLTTSSKLSSVSKDIPLR